MYNMDNLIISFTDEFRVLLLYPQKVKIKELNLSQLKNFFQAKIWPLMFLDDINFIFFFFLVIRTSFSD